MDWLTGKRVAISGKLVSMTKADAVQVVVRHGGQVVPAVTHNTSILVVGQESWPLQKDGRPSKALLRAKELQQAGSPIFVLPEDDFIAKLGLNGEVQGVHRMYTFSQLI